MKKICFGMVLLSMSSTCISIPKKFFFEGSFEYAQTSKPAVKLFYGGNRITLNQGINRLFFKIYENPAVTIFNILITQNASFITDGNAIANIVTVPSYPARYFHLTRRTTCPIDQPHQDQEKIWDIKEVTIKKHPFKVPRDFTLVILADPDYFTHDSADLFSQEPYDEHEAIIKLPTIRLKTAHKQHTDTSDNSIVPMLASIDLNAINANMHEEVKHIGLTTITYCPL